MQAKGEVLEVRASGGRGVGGKSKEEVLEVSARGPRGVGGRCKRRKRGWR